MPTRVDFPSVDEVADNVERVWLELPNEIEKFSWPCMLAAEMNIADQESANANGSLSLFGWYLGPSPSPFRRIDLSIFLVLIRLTIRNVCVDNMNQTVNLREI